MRSKKFNPAKLKFVFTLFTFSLLFTACGNNSVLEQSTEKPISTSTLSHTQIPESEENKSGFQSFTVESLGLVFKFPENWYGPDIYEWDQGVRIAIGSDIVYPYGTDRVDQVYQAKDSYYVTIQYEMREDGLLNNTYLDVLDLDDGESIETPRSLITRVRALNQGDFSGIEYTATLSETAQTEIFFVREVVFFDNNTRFITITGSPNNVIVSPGENWQEKYRSIDQDYQDIFYEIIESIVFL